MKRNDADKRTKVHRPDERKSETIDGATGTVTPTPRRIDLSTLRDVRLEIAAVYRLEDSGELETHRATRKVWILRELANVLALSELEKRILELEEQQARGGGLIPGQRQLPARTLN